MRDSNTLWGILHVGDREVESIGVATGTGAGMKGTVDIAATTADVVIGITKE
jgi:hypothetical protein